MKQLLDNINKLNFGIELVAAMKASSYEVDIEEGRIMALEGTEIDRIETPDPEWFNNLSEKDKQIAIKGCELETLQETKIKPLTWPT